MHIHLQPTHMHTSHTHSHHVICTVLAGVIGCKSNPCKHGGTCSKSGAGYNCTCVNGYEGNNCGGWYCTPYAGSLYLQCHSITSKIQTEVLVIIMHEFDQRYGVSYFVICLR